MVASVAYVKWQLWRAAILSFWQTLRCRPKINDMTFSDVMLRNRAKGGLEAIVSLPYE